MTIDAEVNAGNYWRPKHLLAKMEDAGVKRDIERREHERAYQLSLAEFKRQNELENA